ncbi:MAG: hypothetical protein RBG13Loki_3843 [Promethearchaeota archaeon CR_4]|nr:MAG: hypothetical protein RBG13Loki_3843 [Candidatus Lokiarchaeota archaeon CR_4]
MGTEKEAVRSFELGKYHSSLGNIRNAILNYLKAIELDPKMNMAWSNLAAEYFRLKNYANAINCAKSALQANNQDSMAWLNLGASYFQINDDGRALYCLQRARDLGNPKAKAFLTDAAKSLDHLLRANPIDVSHEIILRIVESPRGRRGESGFEKSRYLTLKCSHCHHSMTFEISHYQQLPEIVCESCGAELPKKELH